MDNIIILGLIPGTNIQISFWAYIALMIFAIAAFFGARRWYRHRTFEIALPQRVLLHANELHFRG